jgi:hypothetical protein
MRQADLLDEKYPKISSEKFMVLVPLFSQYTGKTSFVGDAETISLPH